MARAYGEVEVINTVGAPQRGVPVDLLDPVTGLRITDTIFADASSGVTLSLPLTTDNWGRASFFLAAGKVVKASYTVGGISYTDLVAVTDPTATGGGGGAPSGPAGGDLAGTYPSPTLTAGAATGAKLGADVVVTTDARMTNARPPTAHATTHQSGGSDVMAIDAAVGTGSLRTIGTGATQAAAGNHGPHLTTAYQTVQDEGTALAQRLALNFVGAGVNAIDDAINGVTKVTIPGGTNGLIFSASSYGVVGDNNNATATANSTALDNCIAAAHTAGPGSKVALDWAGTAYLNGGHTIWTQLWYQGQGWNTVAKLANARPAGTHLFQTNNFATLTQTQFAVGTGEYEFQFERILLDGNKANNTSGGHDLAIAGYAYWLDLVAFTNAHSSGLWGEYNDQSEPINTGVGNNRGRAARFGRLNFWNNDCATVAATNGRAGRTALGGAQMVLYGPGDSDADYIECARNGSVAGTGLLVGGMDFASGQSSVSFSLVCTKYVCWLNHSIGLDIQVDDCSFGFIHVEGATTNVRLAGQQLRLAQAKVFIPQSAGTNFQIASGGNFSDITMHMASCNAGGKYLDFAASTLSDSKVKITVENGATLTATLGGGTAPSNAKDVEISGWNYGSGTITGGWVPAIPNGSTVNFRLWQQKAPLQIMGSATLHSGSGVPAAGLGANGDFYFRTDTPGTGSQRLYVRSAGAWVGIV